MFVLLLTRDEDAFFTPDRFIFDSPSDGFGDLASFPWGKREWVVGGEASDVDRERGVALVGAFGGDGIEFAGDLG